MGDLQPPAAALRDPQALEHTQSPGRLDRPGLLHIVRRLTDADGRLVILLSLISSPGDDLPNASAAGYARARGLSGLDAVALDPQFLTGSLRDAVLPGSR